MRPAYLMTVHEKGGYLSEYKEPAKIECIKHFGRNFGVFMDLPGHKQGNVVVNKKLLAYIGLIVMGDYSLYSMIIGHGDYLKHDIMALLHIETMRWVMQNTQAKYLEYGQVGSGTKGLQDWKRYFLFKAMSLNWEKV